MNPDYIKQNEGYRALPYRCTEGYLTIGYGFNLDSGMPEELASLVFEWQLAQCERFLACFAFWSLLAEDRKTVLLDMVFQMGPAGFNKFKKVIAALHLNDYEEAARQILDSKYAQQTPKRARKNADVMRCGSF